MSFSIHRRAWLTGAGAIAGLGGATQPARAIVPATPGPWAIDDDGWTLWLDHDARWQNDRIYLPADVPPVKDLPVNPPTGGWDALYKGQGLKVSLPATVEQFYWGQFQSRPYGVDEYKYAGDDPVPRNGAYVGVSWWVKDLDMRGRATGPQTWLHVRGARQRAEVFLNEQLVGYSVMGELPFDCDLTPAMKPNGSNRLAIRLTNPGGGYDWKDASTVTWGDVKFYPGHGFGGLDRGLMLSTHPAAGRISDAWVLNTPEPRTVTAHVQLAGVADIARAAGALKLELSAVDGRPVTGEVLSLIHI